MSFTVIERLQALGLTATKSERWAIGAAVRQRWLDLKGQLPEKALRSKTAGNGGSHCFAVYPDSFIPEADPVIQGICKNRAAQKTLF